MLTSLKNRLVRLSSEDKNTSSSTSNSQFKVDLPGADLDKVKGFSLVYASVPNIFPNVPSYKSTLLISSITGATNYTVPVTVGQYTLTQFLAQLKIDIEAVIPDTVAIAASAQNILTFTWTGDTYSVTFAGSTLAPIIGLTADLAGGATSVMQSQVNLSGESEVWIHSRKLNPGGMTEADGIFSAFGVIALDNPYGAVCYMRSPDHVSSQITFGSRKSLRSIDIVLRNRTGEVLVLPDNFHFSMLIKAYLE